MSKQEAIKKAVEALTRERGDDLYRSQSAFRNCTPEEMRQEYGQSGQTRQQILDGYKSHHDLCNEAISIIQAL